MNNDLLIPNFFLVSPPLSLITDDWLFDASTPMVILFFQWSCFKNLNNQTNLLFIRIDGKLLLVQHLDVGLVLGDDREHNFSPFRETFAFFQVIVSEHLDVDVPANE